MLGSMGDEDGGSRTRLLASVPARGCTLGVTPLNGALGPCQDFEDREGGLVTCPAASSA